MRGLGRHGRLTTLAVLALLGPGAGGCQKPAPEAPSAKSAALPPLEVVKGGKWLFTYADGSGAFTTTDDAAAVPAGSRRLVRVIDASRPGESKDGVSVYAIDVGELLRAGKATARVLTRGAFE